MFNSGHLFHFITASECCHQLAVVGIANAEHAQPDWTGSGTEHCIYAFYVLELLVQLIMLVAAGCLGLDASMARASDSKLTPNIQHPGLQHPATS